MSNGSIDLLANDEQTPSLTDNGMSLDSDETYRLFISLQEQFQQKDVCQGRSHAQTSRLNIYLYCLYSLKYFTS